MRLGGQHRVRKVIRELILLSAEVEPGMRVLVDEQRRGRGDEFIILVNQLWPAKAAPALGRDRMRGRADRQQIEHHQFAIRIPSQWTEAKFRLPFEGEGVSAVQCPWPVNAPVNPRRRAANRGVAEIGAAGQYSAQQNRHVNGRQLRLRESSPVAHVQVVIEKPVPVRGMLQEVKRLPDPGRNLGARPVVVLMSDAQRRQSKAGRGNAAHPAVAAAVGFGAVSDEAGVRIGFVPEKLERGARYLVQQLRVGTGCGGCLRQQYVGCNPPPVKRRTVEPIISVRINSRRVRVIEVARNNLQNWLRVSSVQLRWRFWSRGNLQEGFAKVSVFG